MKHLWLVTAEVDGISRRLLVETGSPSTAAVHQQLQWWRPVLGKHLRVVETFSLPLVDAVLPSAKHEQSLYSQVYVEHPRFED